MVNSDYDNLHSADDFSHAYVIMHKYFGKNWVHKLLYTIEHVFLHENFLQMLPTLKATNSKPSEYKKSTKWPQKNHFPCNLLKMDSI